jgi:Lectin C-type domain
MRNFSDALSVCQQMGARMAVINSERESQYLVNLVQRSRNPAATSVPYTFVGLFFDGAWKTTDGTFNFEVTSKIAPQSLQIDQLFKTDA